MPDGWIPDRVCGERADLRDVDELQTGLARGTDCFGDKKVGDETWRSAGTSEAIGRDWIP